MKKILLKKIQAFVAMQRFLDQYYWHTLSDDFGSMQGSLMFLNDDKPADEAFEEDWVDSVNVIVPGYQEGVLLTVGQAYAVVKEFLELYCRIGFSAEVQQLINRMALNQTGQIIDIEIREFWNKAVELAISEGPMYLQLGPPN